MCLKIEQDEDFIEFDNVRCHNNENLKNGWFSARVEKVVRIVSYGPAISQSDCRKTSPYQLSYDNNYLLTGYKGRTRIYKPKVFPTAQACEGCVKRLRACNPGTARANPVSEQFIICLDQL